MIALENPAKNVTKVLAFESRRRRRELQGRVEQDEAAAGEQRNDLLVALVLAECAIDALKTPNRKLRRAEAKQVAQIIKSIMKFGFVAPILIDEDGRIIDGLARLEAAKACGLKKVPCIVVSHLTPEERRLLRLAINRLGETGQWDLEELSLEFQELLDGGASLEVTGFTLPEIDQITLLGDPTTDIKANAVPVVNENRAPVSRVNDLWRAITKRGEHLILCGDATKPECYALLFADGRMAAMVCSDPPYNVTIDGFAVGSGKTHHREFVAASGEMSDDEFDTFLARFLAAASDVLVDGGLIYCFMDWRHIANVLRAACRVHLTQKDLIIWNKGHGGLGGLYRSAHELILLFKKGDGPIRNNVELGKHGRDRSNVWTYPAANQRGSSANKQAGNHPTPKPTELIADALRDVTAKGELVLDPFAGSGTTIIAAEKTGRSARVMELDPLYVDLIIERFQDYTGTEVIHVPTGKTFAQIAEERRAEAATAASAGDEASEVVPTVPNMGPADVPVTDGDAR